LFPTGSPSPGTSTTYAGVGARETPPDALSVIERIAEQLARAGWTLRTGLSPGADQAFYKGARAGGGRVELYLPWPGFQAGARVAGARVDGARVDGEHEQVRVLERPRKDAYALAARFHPAWGRLTECERHLRARDVHEVLGESLADPVAFVLGWTADGSLDGSGPLTGGTGQALRIAHDRAVPVFNLARPEHMRLARSAEHSV
jgi:hypothetical protein